MNIQIRLKVLEKFYELMSLLVSDYAKNNNDKAKEIIDKLQDLLDDYESR